MYNICTLSVCQALNILSNAPAVAFIEHLCELEKNQFHTSTQNHLENSCLQFTAKMIQKSEISLEKSLFADAILIFI